MSAEDRDGIPPVNVALWTAVVGVIAMLVVAGWYVDSWLDQGDDGGEHAAYTTYRGYPLVDGSTSAHPLGMMVCCHRLNVPYEWRRVVSDNTYRLFPEADHPEHDAITRWVNHTGTHGSYVRLIEGDVDLALVARLPSDDELELANDLAVELRPVAVALDAFVFIVNVECNVSALTTADIRGIHTGGITHWSEVGGDSHEINPYQRNPNSGSQELMVDLVMGDRRMLDAPDMILMGMMGPINVLSWDRYGIGYSVYYFEEFMAPNEAIQLVEVDGVLPAYDTIQDRSYPYTTEVYAVVRGDVPDDHPAKQLQDWLVSDAGQEVVKESGYVPLRDV